jgi:hypothetical protein
MTRGSHFSISQLERPGGYFRYGRPGLFACLASDPDGIKVPFEAKDWLRLLANKLMNAFPDQQEHVTMEQALAILGVRTTITVTASCHVAHALTSSHMRLCVGVSEDRESLFTFQYP